LAHLQEGLGPRRPVNAAIVALKADGIAFDTLNQKWFVGITRYGPVTFDDAPSHDTWEGRLSVVLVALAVIAWWRSPS